VEICGSAEGPKKETKKRATMLEVYDMKLIVK
jgi:hypothetical protein